MSDVTFMSFDRAGQVAEVGAYGHFADQEDPTYVCEVSCVDQRENVDRSSPAAIGALTGQ